MYAPALSLKKRLIDVCRDKKALSPQMLRRAPEFGSEGSLSCSCSWCGPCVLRKIKKLGFTMLKTFSVFSSSSPVSGIP